MASITIVHGHKNLLFAASVANETGAEFEENGQWIIISDSPDLTIPRYCWEQIVDPDGRRAQQGDSRLESGWRSLLLNKTGYLRYFGDDEIYITDDKPKEERPQFLLRFPDAASKAEAEEWAERAGFESLTAYILEAIKGFNEFWQEQAGEGEAQVEGEISWERFMGEHVASDVYGQMFVSAEGIDDMGLREQIAADLHELWGDPRQGDDYLSPQMIAEITVQLATEVTDAMN